MNRQLVSLGERITLVMTRGAEAQLLVVRNRSRHIRDDEDRLRTNDALHSAHRSTRRGGERVLGAASAAGHRLRASAAVERALASALSKRR
jgi:hypothetical protein